MQVTKISATQKLQKKKLVCAYARVSNDKDSMLHSLSAQVQYYKEYISSNDDWLFVKVYYDEGISGTKEDRPAFMQMVEDAKEGKIDLIITKSISRFARNTLTLLETVRELKSHNVDVYFEEQRIHSISSDGELMLTILASYAQEEARSVSENMKWRIKKDFEQGVIWGSKDQLGYRIVDRKLVLVPDEVELVRKIYNLYLEGYGVQSIAKRLNQDGDKSINGNSWHKSMILLVLKNINYTGDLLLQKTFRESYLTKKKHYNKGEQNQYLVEDDHEPIISKEMFYEVQRTLTERAKRFKTSNKPNNINLFTGLIRCGICKKNYRRKKGTVRWIWTCATFNVYGKAYCNSKSIPEETLIDITKKVLKTDDLTIELIKQKIEYIDALDGNRLVYHLRNGNIVEMSWQALSRRDCWTPEMKEQARQRALEQMKAKEGANNG